MRRIVVALLGTISGLVMLFSYHTSTSSVTAGSTGSTGSSGSTGSTGSTGSAAAAGSKTYRGDMVQTRWGPVQVAIKVVGGKITAVDAIVYPQDNPRDVEINSYAVPTLNQEALAAQSATIDMVSGATVTSRGYLTSLQSALDAAQL
jgi:uncharacterized protein with FMN-binding domain